MAPAATQVNKSEDAKALKVLDDLFSQLSIAKEAEEVIGASNNIATYINGDIEEAGAPTQYVLLPAHTRSASLPPPPCRLLTRPPAPSSS